jgi:hypothetical protein
MGANIFSRLQTKMAPRFLSAVSKRLPSDYLARSLGLHRGNYAGMH